MTDGLDRTGHPECHICGDRLKVSDPVAERRDLDPDGDGYRIVKAHRACLKEGVERWCRNNRRYSDPLAASRRAAWSWHIEPATDA